MAYLCSIWSEDLRISFVNDEKRQNGLTRDQEVWGMALWVERVHGNNGWFHIATEQDRLLAAGDLDGVALWRVVQQHWELLQSAKTNRH